MLEHVSSRSIAWWYQHLLARETWARQALEAHVGKTARYRLGLLSVALTVLPGGQIGAADAGVVTPAVAVTLDPLALGSALTDPGVMLRNMTVEGDLEFARILSETLSRLRPDPAEDLSRWVGDAAAQRIIDVAAQALTQIRDRADRFVRQGSDYLMAESAQLVGRTELSCFSDDVAALRSRLALLEDLVSTRRSCQKAS